MIRAALLLSLLVFSFQAPPRADKAPTAGWPTYNGDFTGRGFSPLTKITDRNVKALSLAWSYRLSVQGAGPIKGTPLVVNGIVYLTAPDHVWALDARSGREIWHFENKSTGGIHIGNRG